MFTTALTVSHQEITKIITQTLGDMLVTFQTNLQEHVAKYTEIHMTKTEVYMTTIMEKIATITAREPGHPRGTPVSSSHN